MYVYKSYVFGLFKFRYDVTRFVSSLPEFSDTCLCTRVVRKYIRHDRFNRTFARNYADAYSGSLSASSLVHSTPARRDCLKVSVRPRETVTYARRNNRTILLGRNSRTIIVSAETNYDRMSESPTPTRVKRLN